MMTAGFEAVHYLMTTSETVRQTFFYERDNPKTGPREVSCAITEVESTRSRTNSERMAPAWPGREAQPGMA
jgi:hypothetical protein